MINRLSNDRIILFTLVDLLIQIIFFGFFLFAINRAREGDLAPKLAALVARVGIVRMTQFVDATSKLVSISDLAHVDVVGSGPSLKALDDLTDLIKVLDRHTLTELTTSGLSGRQLADVSKLFRSLSNDRRDKLISLLSKFSDDGNKLLEVLAAYRALSAKDVAKLAAVARAYAGANAEVRTKISSAAAVTLAKPACFADNQALAVVSIANAYLVKVLPTTGSQFMAAQLEKYALVGSYREVPIGSFDGFGQAVDSQFPNCYVRVEESSKTDLESQFKTILRYFYQ